MDQNSSGPLLGVLVVALAFGVFVIASMWKVYTKAGQPGWACIVPIYNLIVLHRMTGTPLWWLILYFVPLVNIIIIFAVHISLAKAFGKRTGFGIGLSLLGFIFFPILGYGDARYQGPSVIAVPTQA